jgi:release factor glutamine methyltransferase
MTIRDATHRLISQLRNLYEEGEAASISDWVIEYLTGIRKTDRLSRKETDLSPEQESRLEAIIERLMKHEPIQYVLNEEWVISDCKFPIDKLKILDVGTGSGCIPVALKRRLGKAEVWACDISEDAIDIAMKNAESLGAAVDFLVIDFLENKERERLPSFDIITCNPPYIPISDREGMAANVTSYEPNLALFVPNDDPLIFYRHLAEFGKSHLNQHGRIYAEIYEKAGKEIVELFKNAGFTVELKKDISGKHRMIRATSQLVN